MSNSIKISGRVHAIMETKQISEKFSKREFVLEIERDSKYPQTVLLEATGRSIGALDAIRVNDEVEVEINLRGREWRSPAGEIKYFNTLTAWKIDLARPATAGNSTAPTTSSGGEQRGYPIEDPDELPFMSSAACHDPSPIARILR